MALGVHMPDVIAELLHSNVSVLDDAAHVPKEPVNPNMSLHVPDGSGGHSGTSALNGITAVQDGFPELHGGVSGIASHKYVD
ncbi:MAG: hypothetical protein A3C90_02520 [Candidatus Magasanikbacteria bacterium RIFCSPHIGHO2_02_FULL_51_14]|uniref:Uncharacterized protein n=1 Tax=Candidatus Magasanikbacteria bacterium RIFCSPHIGHO2_02_FULL_51_14 TaxID=1798683 RepID=A0A1F6MD66_9BACT|nr:MAG: hypothetical protein A3C90_02520 [Candidatus Magasanikbacteria bacterium RIFCSPHIGHO2_02_FULL_51_14]